MLNTRHKLEEAIAAKKNNRTFFTDLSSISSESVCNHSDAILPHCSRCFLSRGLEHVEYLAVVQSCIRIVASVCACGAS